MKAVILAAGKGTSMRELTQAVLKPMLSVQGRPILVQWGIYLFRPSLFEFTSQLQKSPRGEYELTDAIAQLIETRHRIAGLRVEGRWVDARDPEVLARLERGEL